MHHKCTNETHNCRQYLTMHRANYLLTNKNKRNIKCILVRHAHSGRQCITCVLQVWWHGLGYCSTEGKVYVWHMAQNIPYSKHNSRKVFKKFIDSVTQFLSNPFWSQNWLTVKFHSLYLVTVHIITEEYCYTSSHCMSRDILLAQYTIMQVKHIATYINFWKVSQSPAFNFSF